MQQRQVLIGCVFLVGCVTGGIGSQFVSPPARAGTTPQRWEYICAEAPSVADLNQAGRNGWELVTATLENGTTFAGPTLCLKRPL
jgi:hypothetical protein